MMMRTLPWLVLPVLLASSTVEYRPAPTTTITDVSLTHRDGTAYLSIAVDGAVAMQEDSYKNPDRVVLDFTGTTMGKLSEYDGLRRGHVTGVRVYQLEPTIVRLILQLDKMQTYAVNTSQPRLVTISFLDEEFQPWNANPAAPRIAVESTGSSIAADRVFLPSGGPQQAQDRLSFTWVKNSYEEVVTQLALSGNRSIILSRGVTSVPVTMTLKEKTWSQAFNAFLESQKLAAREIDGGIIKIDDPISIALLDSLERPETRQVKLNYAKAISLVSNVDKMVSKPNGQVSADSATNSLLITDVPSKLNGIVALLSQLDVRSRMIAIEAKIVFVDRTDLDQLGVKYDLGNRSQFSNKLVQRTDPTTGASYSPNLNVVDLYGSSVSAIANADALISGSALDLIFSTAIGGYSVTSFLSALNRIDLTDVEATPVIYAQDNREAFISSGEETPVRVIDLSSAGGGAGAAPRATVQFKETGIILKVRPHVTNNDQIELLVDAERSSVQTLAAADLGYFVPKQHAVSTLMLSDGQTGMLGGLVVSTITKNRSGIPFLSSLPFIGSLFSFTENRENRKDLIITVTPRLVN